jgi:ribosomal protein L16 Arg81 hydroxylase
VDDLVANCQEQWREGHDLHLDTLDVYLIEVRGRRRRRRGAAARGS